MGNFVAIYKKKKNLKINTYVIASLKINILLNNIASPSYGFWRGSHMDSQKLVIMHVVLFYSNRSCNLQSLKEVVMVSPTITINNDDKTKILYERYFFIGKLKNNNQLDT